MTRQPEHPGDPGSPKTSSRSSSSRPSSPSARSRSAEASPTLILAGQGGHLACLILLFIGLIRVTRLPGFPNGALLGLPTATWFWLTIGSAILHQSYVWFAWCTELHGGLLTRTFGPRAFILYAIGFAILIVAAPSSSPGSPSRTRVPSVSRPGSAGSSSSPSPSPPSLPSRR